MTMPITEFPMARDPHPAAGSAPGRGLVIIGVVTGLAAAFVLTTGIASRSASDANLRKWTDAQAVPTVGVVTPRAGGNISALDLPGRLEAFIRAPIHARVGGYLNIWHADIGTRVKAGQLLAEIEAPDLDQQFLQAKATLASAQASEALAQTTAQRFQALIGTNSVSRQAIDEKLADLTVRQAQTRAAQAALDRLEVMAAFKRVVAPFDGIVTARNVDVGQLIGADSAGSMALFVVSEVSKLRLYVNVPQVFVPQIPMGAKATLSVPEYPDRTFTAVVEASSRAVDAASGTTRFQLSVDNAEGELMPGSFANVRFDIGANAKLLDIPASALIIDQAGIRVATVDGSNRVVFRTVTIGRDLGRVVEIAAGLQADDRVIESPPDGLIEGDPVRVVDPAAPAAVLPRSTSR
jgi:RND family efflux transporter MFP subunit